MSNPSNISGLFPMCSINRLNLQRRPSVSHHPRHVISELSQFISLLDNDLKNPSEKYSLSPRKKNSRISCSDFWSEKMKAKILHMSKLKTKRNLGHIDFSNSAKSLEQLPPIQDKLKRSTVLNNKMKNNYLVKDDFIPAIENIIGKCNSARHNTKKLSYQLTASTRVIRPENLISKNFDNKIYSKLNNLI